MVSTQVSIRNTHYHSHTFTSMFFTAWCPHVHTGQHDMPLTRTVTSSDPQCHIICYHCYNKPPPATPVKVSTSQHQHRERLSETEPGGHMALEYICCWFTIADITTVLNCSQLRDYLSQAICLSVPEHPYKCVRWKTPLEHTCTHLQHSSTMTVVQHLNSALVGSGKPPQSPDLRILMKYHSSPHTMDKQDIHKVCIITNIESIRSPIETGLV